MTTDLEKQFFQCFCIEAKEKVNQTFNGAEFKVETIKEYPQITDHILLELICIISTFGCGHHHCYRIWADNVKELKENTLKDCIELQQVIEHQVQELFKEG